MTRVAPLIFSASDKSRNEGCIRVAAEISWLKCATAAALTFPPQQKPNIPNEIAP